MITLIEKLIEIADSITDVMFPLTFFVANFSDSDSNLMAKLLKGRSWKIVTISSERLNQFFFLCGADLVGIILHVVRGTGIKMRSAILSTCYVLKRGNWHSFPDG